MAASEISAGEALEVVGASVWLLDVREEAEWLGGHVPQAHLIPMSTLQERFTEIPDDQRILVMCHSGYRSWQVAKALDAVGFDALSLAGGIEAWQAAGGAVVQDGAAPSTF